MRSFPIVFTLVVFLAAAVPGVVGVASAEPVPAYFGDEWVGFYCLTATPPGSGPIPILLQLNFDKVAFGGIPLTRADSLFAYVGNNLGVLSPLIGPNPPKTCTLTPSQVVSSFNGATALDAVQQVSPTFGQLGFARYVVYDLFLSFAVVYSGSINTLRGEAFRVVGTNDLTFALGTDYDLSLVP